MTITNGFKGPNPKAAIIDTQEKVPAGSPPKTLYRFSFRGKDKELSLELETYDYQIANYTVRKTLDLEFPSPEDEITLKYQHSPSEPLYNLGIKKNNLEDFFKYYEIDEESKTAVKEIEEIVIERHYSSGADK